VIEKTSKVHSCFHHIVAISHSIDLRFWCDRSSVNHRLSISMEHVYFDTNALWSSKWPNLTGTQDRAFKLARRFDCRLHLVDVVKTELRELWLRQHRKAMATYVSSLQGLNHSFSTVRLGEIPVFDWDGGPEAYERQVDTLISMVPFTVTETTQQPVSVLVERAAKRQAPFQDHDKGFRDTALLLSIMEDLSEPSDVYLVSADSIFESPAVVDEIALLCRRFTLLKKCDALAELFVERLNSPELEAIARDQERARYLIQQNAPLLVSQLASRYLVGTIRSPVDTLEREYVVFVREVRSAAADDVSDIAVSDDPSRTLTEFGLAVSFKCVLHAEVVLERRQIPSGVKSESDRPWAESPVTPGTELATIDIPLSVEGVFLPGGPGDFAPVRLVVDSITKDSQVTTYFGPRPVDRAKYL